MFGVWGPHVWCARPSCLVCEASCLVCKASCLVCKALMFGV